MVEVAPPFGRQDNIVPVPLQSVAENLFAMSMSIDISRIEEVASKLKGSFNRSERDFVVCGSVAVPIIVSSYRPRPKSHLTDFETCLSKGPEFHSGALSKQYPFQMMNLQNLSLA